MATLKNILTYNGQSSEVSGETTLQTAGMIMATNLGISPTVTLNLQEKTVTFTSDTTGSLVTPDAAYDGLSSVNVVVQAGTSGVNNYDISISPATTTQTRTVGDLPVHDPVYTGYGTVTVPAAPLETKSVTPTESQQVITATSGNYGLSQVTVAGITPTYVGSQVPNVTKTATTTLTVTSGGTATTLPTLTPGYKLNVTPQANTTGTGYITQGAVDGTAVIIPVFALS